MSFVFLFCICFFFQAEDGIRDLVRSRGLGDVYKRQVVITLGENGCFCISSNGSWRFDAIPSKVIDTTGAGDAFCAGIVSGIFQGFDLYSACAWATCVASISVETLGTIPSFPKLEEVKKKFGSIAKNFIRINKYHNKHKEDCDDL